MATELDALPLEKPRKLRLDWVGPLFWRPRSTLTKIMQEARSTWLTPLLILTILSIAVILIAGPLKQAAASAVPKTPPADFQYWSPDAQKQYLQSASTTTSATFMIVFPAAAELLKVWLGWFLLGAILHLVLILGGSRTSLTQALNLAGWASLPSAVRYLVQIGSMLFSQQLITHPGLSGFAPESASVLVRYLGAVLPFIDIYLLWTIVLLIVGALILAGVNARKVWGSVLVSIVILLLLEALPAFIGSQLGSIGTSGPMGGGVG